jgi:hypothetical protein
MTYVDTINRAGAANITPNNRRVLDNSYDRSYVNKAMRVSYYTGYRVFDEQTVVFRYSTVVRAGFYVTVSSIAVALLCGIWTALTDDTTTKWIGMAATIIAALSSVIWLELAKREQQQRLS